MPAWPSRQSRADNLDAPLVTVAVGSDDADRPSLDQPGGAGRPLEATASVWHQITFGWLDSLIAEGYRRECLLQRSGQPGGASGDSPPQPDGPVALTERDLLELRPDDTPEELRRRIDDKWTAELAAGSTGAAAARQDGASLENGGAGAADGGAVAQPSYKKALWQAFGRTYVAAGLFKFVYDTLQMAGPFILRKFLSYLNHCEKLEQSGSETCEVNEGLLLVVLICVTNLIQTAFLHQYFHRAFRTGMRMNAATISVIYSKALRLAGPGKGADAAQRQDGEGPKQRTSGEIVNLMSVDSQRLQDTMTYLHTLWSGPYQIIITLIFLSQVVHWATFAGLAVMLLQIPIMTFVTRRIRVAQRALMQIKDERVKVTNEVFSSMKLLKMYGWEDSFGKRIDDIRETELGRLRTYQLLNIISTALYATTPILTGVATFGVYTALYGKLTAATAFTALSLFNVLRFPLIMFPNMISSSVEANIAVSRIEEFLASTEIQGRSPPAHSDMLQAAASSSSSTDTPPVARLHQVRLAWPDGTPLLAGLTLSIPAPLPSGARAHMTVVLGAVGTGKSGLLQALIGDLTPVGGSIAIAGSIAYTAQVAWIRNATVKDNILFNKPFNQERYAAVLEQCALLPDLDALPNGELTEIGEKGVNLSGGQKQRVSLARAVYAAPDLLLLDDPLSAVDTEVAKTLLKMLRGDLVKHSSIILCTHHLGAINHADQVVMLERGDNDLKGKEGGDSPPRALETRIAFCSSAADFTQAYPDMLAGQGTLARQLSRQISDDEPAAAAPKADEGAKKSDAGRLVEREEERTGSVSGDVYMTYIQAGGGLWLVVAVIAGVAIGQALQTSADSWVSFWSDHSHHVDGKMYVSSTAGLLGYILFSLSAFIGVMATSAMFRLTALKAARWFHKELLDKMLRLPMTFYDRTPLGRVLNRFSKDIYTVDEQLQQVLYMYLQTLARVIATIVVIAVATPWFLLIVLPLLWMYRYTQNYYIPSSRQLKRIESTLRSPIFSHFAETLDGVASIRAFAQQPQFKAESAGRLRRNMRAYYASVSSNRWLAVRLETLGTAIVTSAGLLATLARDSISAGVAGLSISYALSVTQSLNWVVRMTSDRETNIVSVERLREYIRKEPEPPRTLPDDPPESAWPTQGAIEFKDIQLRYRPDLPLVLQGLSLSIAAQEKMGICGRTGAGKSSVLNVLLRIVTIEGGCTLIDGVDISGLGLHRLRRSITIIPQESVLFSGTLRSNLDPLEQWSGNDEKLWQALARSHLEAHARTLGASPSSPGTSSASVAGSESSLAPLDTNVAEAGGNFSVGQRQQLCLARALLRTNHILLLDEATSAVDHETDALIQETIRTEFASYTVLCIAHRISTIMGFDRVCVLESGKVAELGAPKELMEQEGSRFQRLAKLDASH